MAGRAGERARQFQWRRTAQALREVFADAIRAREASR